jgi:protease I
MSGEKKILIFVHNFYEELELHYPRIRLIEEGYKVHVAGPESDTTYEGKNGYPCKSDVAIQNMSADDFDGLVIPGGYAPDKLRTMPKALELTRKFDEQGKLVAFICHAGWVPASAGILKGRKCTSYHAIKDDVINAGADWSDEPVVVDKNLVSSRMPKDLPVFCRSILKILA